MQVIGKNELSLYSYLDNVLEQHFATYQEEISEMCIRDRCTTLYSGKTFRALHQAAWIASYSADVTVNSSGSSTR